MLKRILLTGSALLLAAGLSSAASILTQNNQAGGLPVAGADGTPLSNATGFAVIGGFDAGFDIAAAFAAADTAAIDAAFTQFGGELNLEMPLAGFFSQDVSAGIADGDTLVGQNFFIVAGEGSGIGDATSLIVLQDAGQTFQFDAPVFEAVADAKTMTPIIGQAGQIDVGPAVIAGIVGEPVPEPSAALLLGFSAAAVFLRRRRS